MQIFISQFCGIIIYCTCTCLKSDWSPTNILMISVIKNSDLWSLGHGLLGTKFMLVKQVIKSFSFLCGVSLNRWGAQIRNVCIRHPFLRELVKNPGQTLKDSSFLSSSWWSVVMPDLCMFKPSFDNHDDYQTDNLIIVIMLANSSLIFVLSWKGEKEMTGKMSTGSKTVIYFYAFL